MNDKKLKIILITFLILSFGLLVYEIKIFYDLKQEFNELNNRLKELQEIKKNIAKIEEQLAKERLIEESIFTRVPEGKESIFDLMRELTVYADKFGGRDINFSIEDDDERGGSGRKSKGKGKSSREVFKGKKGNLKSILGGDVEDHYFEMDFQAGFLDFTEFTESLLKMDRIVLIEALTVDRRDNILPRQNVTFNLITYTFSSFK